MAQVDDTAKALMTNLLSSSSGFFANEATVEGGFSNATRSMIQLGAPLKGYNDENDAKDDQGLMFRYFFGGFTCPVETPKRYAGKDLCEGVSKGTRIVGLEQTLFDFFEMRGVPATGSFAGAIRSAYYKQPVHPTADGGLRARFYSSVMQTLEFARVVNGDLNYAIVSIACVFFYMWFHTRSALLASTSMLQIVLSLPVGYFFYFNGGVALL